MDDNEKIWHDFNFNLSERNYDAAAALWDSGTRNIFRKGIQDFRRKQQKWKIIEYIGTTSDEYLLIVYSRPKGLIAKLVLAYNTCHSEKKSTLGRIISSLYDMAVKVRNKGNGRFNILCGILLKRFDILAKEFRQEKVIKHFSIIQENGKKYIGWSYLKSIILHEAPYVYEFDTFVFYSAIDYTAHLKMLKKLDSFNKSILANIKTGIPRINIYFHGKVNNPNTGIPKSFFVAPGSNDICIYSIRISINTLKHEMLHAIIYSATSSWPPLFFREGYAESYELNKDVAELILKNKFKMAFLLTDRLFFDYTKAPSLIAGFFIRYLIDTYGIERFYSAYRYADRMSINKALKSEYGFNIFQLTKNIKIYLRSMNS